MGLRVAFLAFWLGLFQPKGWADVIYTVDTTNLDAISAAIDKTPDILPHRVEFAKFSNVGTFRIGAANTSKAEAIYFVEKPETPGIIKLDSNPLLDIQNFKKPIVLSGLSIQLMSPTASISTTDLASQPNGSLTLRDCLIFGDNLASRNFLAWAGGPGSKVSFERCFFVIRTSQGADITQIRVKADTLSISNCNINMAGLVEANLVAKFRMAYNTVNRLQFKLDGSTGVQADITNNLFAFPGGTNQISGTATFYPLALSSAYVTQPTGIASNKIYPGWAGVFQSAYPELVNAGTPIAPVAGKDTTELWNWYVAPETTVGFHNGPDKAQPFNVFPRETSFSKLKIGSDSVTLFFAASVIPRLLNVSSVPEALGPADYPRLRYAWADNKSRTFGNFQIDSIQLDGSLAAIHGVPQLLVRANSKDTLQLLKAYGTKGGRRTFINTLPAAKYFIPAYDCELPRGRKVIADTRSNSDSLIFDQIDSAGSFTYVGSIAPDAELDIRKDVRYLILSMGYNTTAKFSDTGQMVFRTNRTPDIPYLEAKMCWQKKTDPGQGQAAPEFYPMSALPVGNYGFRGPALKDFTAFLMEKLSIPRGTFDSTAAEFTLHSSSQAGYQFLISPAAPPDSDFYDRISAPFQLQTLGRGAGDSLSLTLKPNAAAKGSSLPYFLPVNGQGDLVANRETLPDGRVKVRLTAKEANGKLFLGRKLNIQKNVPFTGLVNGVRVSNFTSPVSGLLKITTLNESDLGVDTVLASRQFVKGWLIEGENLSASDFRISDSAGYALDSSQTRVFYRPSGQVDWIETSLLGTMPGLTVGPVNLLGKSVALLVVQELPPLQSPPLITVLRDTSKLTNRLITFSLNAEEQLRLAGQYSGTQYQVSYTTINANRKDTGSSPLALINTEIALSLATNNLGLYRIKVYNGSRIVATQSGPLPGLFDTSYAANYREYPDSVWHLLAVPNGLNGSLNDTSWLSRSGDLPANIKDTLGIIHLVQGELASIQTPDQRVSHSGEAVFIASGKGKPFRLHWKQEQVPSLEPMQMDNKGQGAGWRLIGNLFPFDLQEGQIISSGEKSEFYRWVNNASGSFWEPSLTMEAYQGYAYYAQADEILTLDPLRAAASPKKSANPGGPLVLRVFTAGGFRQVKLFPGADPEGNIPRLPAMKNAFEVVLGEGKGYFRKAISASGEVDEALRVFSPHNHRIAWDLTGLRPGQKAVLLDSSTGRLIEPGDSLEVHAGWNALRLVAAGDEEIDTRKSLWSQAMSRSFDVTLPGLIQGRNGWTLRYHWPRDFVEKRAGLKVCLLDLKGRVVFEEKWRPQQIGIQARNLAEIRGAGTFILTLQTLGMPKSPLHKRMVTVLP